MHICRIVQLLPLGTVDDLMHHCTQLSASCNSASGHPWRLRVIVLTILQTGMKYLYKANAYKLHNKSENLEIIQDKYMAAASLPSMPARCLSNLQEDLKV